MRVAYIRQQVGSIDVDRGKVGRARRSVRERARDNRFICSSGLGEITVRTLQWKGICFQPIEKCGRTEYTRIWILRCVDMRI